MHPTQKKKHVKFKKCGFLRAKLQYFQVYLQLFNKKKKKKSCSSTSFFCARDADKVNEEKMLAAKQTLNFVKIMNLSIFLQRLIYEVLNS